MQGRLQFLDITLACLGRDSWTIDVVDESLAVFTRTLSTRLGDDGACHHQSLRMFTGMSSDDMEDRAKAELMAADHFIMGFGGIGCTSAVRARAELFPGSIVTELLNPSDVYVRGGDFEPLRGHLLV